MMKRENRYSFKPVFVGDNIIGFDVLWKMLILEVMEVLMVDI